MRKEIEIENSVHAVLWHAFIDEPPARSISSPYYVCIEHKQYTAVYRSIIHNMAWPSYFGRIRGRDVHHVSSSRSVCAFFGSYFKPFFDHFAFQDSI